MPDNGIVVRIRELILSGALPPGGRVTEAGIAELLGVSRTPVRNVLPALEREGLLEERGRGFAVRSFTSEESRIALDTRATIEGMAARVVATRGADGALLATLRDLLAEGDALFAKRCLAKDDEDAYGRMNGRFHNAIVDAAGSPLVSEIYARVNRVPFAAPAVIAFDRYGLDQAFRLLFYAHSQHHGITDAIADGDGARAEFLFREHINQQRASMWTAPPEATSTKRKLPNRQQT